MRDKRRPPKGHWLKWAGRKPENKYPWSIPGYWFRAGARAIVAIFRARGMEVKEAEDIIHASWVEHMHKCEPGLVSKWEQE